MIVKAFLAAILIAAPVVGAAHVPPPPSLPGQDALATQIVRTIESKDATGYAALLSDDVRVFEDGKILARNKAEWLISFGPKLSAEGVSFEVSPGFSSSGRLLFIEYFNSVASWGGDRPAECCWSYDAVAYDVFNGKIITIRRLGGGHMKLNARGEPER